MSALYTRQGYEHTAPVKNDAKGKPFFTEHISCRRCGGAGRGPWRPDGGICYECQGARFTGYRDVPLYTADQLAVLNARKDKADLKRAEKKASEEAARTARIDSERAAWAEALPEALRAAYAWGLTLEGDDQGAASDIARKMSRDLHCSEKQGTYLVKLHAQSQADEVRRAIAVPCPSGRIEITGTILSTKWQDSDYGGALKMLVQSEAGFKLWGSVPSSLEAQRGDVVKFTATVEPSRDDKTFGFFSRPAKALLLSLTA